MPEIKAIIFDCVDTFVKPGEQKIRPEIIKTLPKLSVPYCIITNGDSDKKKLHNTGIYQCFDGRIVETNSNLKKQEMFINIAKTMNISTQECLVIEDNISGTKGAVNSNMKILAYLGENIKFLNYFEIRNAGAWGLLDEMDWLLFLTDKKSKIR